MSSMFKGFSIATMTTPRTILGFFAVVIGILVAGAVGAMFALGSGVLLAVILIVVCLFILVLVAVVVYAMWKDPKRLQLGEVTAQDFIAMHQVTLGDDAGGEYIAGSGPVLPNSPGGSPALPSSDKQEDESE